MAGRKVGVSLSPISQQIKRTQKKLKSIKAKVSAKDKRAIQANIRALGQLDQKLFILCKRMNVTWPVN